jgi:hypothetical protein
MVTSPTTIRELLAEIGHAAKEHGMSQVSIMLPDGSQVGISFHPPVPAPPKPLSEADEYKIKVQNARNELRMQYAHTGHEPSEDEISEYMAMRGDA